MNSVDAPPIPDTRSKPVPPVEGLAPGNTADWVNWATRALEAASDSAPADAEVLMAALLGCERSQLRLHAEKSVKAATVLRYVSWIERCKLGEPVAYVSGRKGFWTLDLVVDASVLIPRPDTERLVEWALEIAREPREQRGATVVVDVLDLGTGSGAIALALADEARRLLPARQEITPSPAGRGSRAAVGSQRGSALMALPRKPNRGEGESQMLRITATDRSESGLTVARENARKLNLDTIEFLSGHWFQPLRNPLRRFNLIVSNPPYLAEHDPHLAQLRYEPRLALTAGPDGLAALREIISDAATYLHPRGWLLVEHGHTQGAAVRDLFCLSGFGDVQTRRDYGGKERVSGGRLP